MSDAQAAAELSDVFLAVGTSLTVYPVAYLPDIALRSGATLAIFNGEATPFDSQASAVVRTPLGDTLDELVSLV